MGIGMVVVVPAAAGRARRAPAAAGLPLLRLGEIVEARDAGHQVILGVTERVQVGVLVSGRGSNLDALCAAAAAPGFPARIALVVSNRRGAGALEVAGRWGVPPR